jgi:hypothetical protein
MTGNRSSAQNSSSRDTLSRAWEPEKVPEQIYMVLSPPTSRAIRITGPAAARTAPKRRTAVAEDAVSACGT